MGYIVLRTTADWTVEAITAAVLKNEPIQAGEVAVFCDISEENATNALEMGKQIGFLSKSSRSYSVLSPLSLHFAGGDSDAKTVVLRILLEVFDPYAKFKRILIHNQSPIIAARQVRALFGLRSTADDIRETLISFGTYTRSIINTGSGQYVIEGTDNEEYSKLPRIINERSEISAYLTARLGPDVYRFIDNNEVFDPLVTALSCLINISNDSRAPIVHAANAVESFLVFLADDRHWAVNFSGATGINSKADRLKTNNKIGDKHNAILKFLGHIRNAADHGVDNSTGSVWNISPSTSVIYVNEAISAIIALVSLYNGTYLI